MDANLTKIILALIGLLAAAAITVTIVFKVKKSSSKVKQKGNIVFGDQAGRDIKK